jgi:hypothetical protein
LLGLLGHLPLPTATASTGTSGLATLARALVLLLLTCRQLLQALERLIHLAIGLLLRPVLHLLVLIAQLVGFELEEVGQVLGTRVPAATAPTAAALHADLHFLEECIDPLQELQCALLRPERIGQLAGAEQFLGRASLRDDLGMSSAIT